MAAEKPNGGGLNGRFDAWVKVVITTMLAIIVGMAGFAASKLQNDMERLQERHEALSASVARMDARYQDLAARFDRGSLLLQTITQQVYDMDIRVKGCVKLCREARPDLE